MPRFPLFTLTGATFGLEWLTVLVVFSKHAATVTVSLITALVEVPLSGVAEVYKVFDFQAFPCSMVIIHANLATG